MKLLCKQIKSHIFQSTNDTNWRGHGVLFQSFSEAWKCRGREEVNRKCYPKVNKCSEKIVFWNGRMVGFTIGKSWVQRLNTAITNIYYILFPICCTTRVDYEIWGCRREQWRLILNVVHVTLLKISTDAFFNFRGRKEDWWQLQRSWHVRSPSKTAKVHPTILVQRWIIHSNYWINSQIRTCQRLKVARLDFSGLIPPKFEP